MEELYFAREIDLYSYYLRYQYKRHGDGARQGR